MDDVRVVSVRVSTLSHATEDRDKVAKAILGLCPIGFPRKLETQKVKGHYGNEIVVLQISARGAKADQFFVHLWTHISQPDRKAILSRIERYVDSSGALHVRIGKQECFMGQVLLHDSDPIKVEVQFAVHGSSDESLLDGVKRKMGFPSGVGPRGLAFLSASQLLIAF